MKFAGDVCRVLWIVLDTLFTLALGLALLVVALIAVLFTPPEHRHY